MSDVKQRVDDITQFSEVLSAAEIESDIELRTHSQNRTMFAPSMWIDLAQTYERLEADSYHGIHQKELDLAFKNWFTNLIAKFEVFSKSDDDEAQDCLAYLKVVAARASAFVEFGELLAAKKKFVRTKLQQIDEGPTNEAIRQIQYGIWWRGLRHAGRVMGLGSILGGVPGAAISFWEPYADLLSDILHLNTSPTMLAAVSSVIFTAIVSVGSGLWMYRSGVKARRDRKRRYMSERRKLMRDYSSIVEEGCLIVDHALARLTRVSALSIDTFAKLWPVIEKRLRAEIDSCYFEEDEEETSTENRLIHA